MVSQKELKELVGKKVLDFAVLSGKENFSVVFDDGRALKFDCDPVEIIEVEEIEEERKEKISFGKRLSNFIDGMFNFTKAILKVIFIIFVLLVILIILILLVRFWPDISNFISTHWGTVKEVLGII